MKNIELQAARKLLMLEPSEAAAHIANVSTRSWQRWEASDHKVPEDVAAQIEDLIQMRNDMLEKREEEFEAAGQPIEINFYRTIEEFITATGKENIVMWRLTQSVAAAMLAEYKAVLI